MADIRSVASPIEREIVQMAERIMRDNGAFPRGNRVTATVEPTNDWCSSGQFTCTSSTLVAHTPADTSGGKVPMIRCPAPKSKEPNGSSFAGKTKVYYHVDDKYDSTVYVDVVALTKADNETLATCITYSVQP